eukprot:snap_masked-scaffold185_size275389-processed-gene-1.14 protein:Tk02520 transcript:snap_masked-scaffold185_size275389-processed-gene-1.14-mRNA-1 annotation:"maternal protein exuperantia-1"
MSPTAAQASNTPSPTPSLGDQPSLVPTGTPVPKGHYVVVPWDMDTTGRRLIDEICQIGAFYQNASGTEVRFAQYVMPYKNPNPGARRSFGIRVVNIGRYRMLKNMETGQILKTKSEVSALQDFIKWLAEAQSQSEAEGVLLACHEPARKVLVPLLLEALSKFNLMDTFQATVKGFVNGTHVVKAFGDMSKVTSYSLRSLCKTVLGDTNPNTNSASDRSHVLFRILAQLTSEAGDQVTADQVATVGVTVASEVEDLAQLKTKLTTQGTLRPIFESQLKQKRNLREKAMALRSLVADAGVNYDELVQLYREPKDEVKTDLQKRIERASDSDIDQLVELLSAHFGQVQE